LFEKILEGAAYITQADMGWILLRSEAGKTLSLAASRNLPAGLAAYTQKPWEDGLSPLVALSGESLAIHGDPIKRFPIARLGLSALIAPIKAKQEVIGILAMMRKADQAFIRTHQNLLEAMADYASVSLVNARLFQILEQRVRVLQQMADSAQLEAQLRAGRLQQSAESLRQPLEQSQAALDSLGGETAGLSGEAQAAVNTARAGLGAVSELLALTPAPRLPEASKGPQRFDLAAAARQAQARLADIARRREVHLVCQAPESGLYTSGSPAQVGDILDTLLLYAIRCSLPAGQVLLHVDAAPAGGLRVVIQDAGPAIEQAEAALMLSRIDAPAGQAALASGRPWIGLKLIRQAIERHGGRFSLLSATGKGVIVQFSMLRIRTLA
jgi:signal transduction histidine kinase